MSPTRIFELPPLKTKTPLETKATHRDLVHAVLEDSDTVVQSLLEANVNPNSSDEDDDIPLILSMYNSNLDITRKLLAARADVNKQEKKSGNSALHLEASHKGRAEAIELLCESKANIELKDAKGNTPLLSAAKDINKHLGLSAITPILKLIDLKADINAKNSAGQTIQHFAYLTQNQWLLVVINEKFPGSKLTLPDANGNTIAHYAIMATQSMKHDLLDADPSDLVAQNKDDDTPLHLAASYDREIIIGNEKITTAEFLLQIFAEKFPKDKIIKILTTQNNEGDTALHLAVDQKFSPMLMKILAEAFLEYKINPDIVNKKGCTPLYIFVNRNHKESTWAKAALMALLKAGANCDLSLSDDQESNPYKKTPLRLANLFQCYWMAFTLEGHKDIPTPEHFKNKYGYTREEFELMLKAALDDAGSHSESELKSTTSIGHAEILSEETPEIEPEPDLPKRVIMKRR